MAIEKYFLNTDDDVVTLLNDLGWFNNVVKGNGYIEASGTVDSQDRTILRLCSPTATSVEATTAFYTLGIGYDGGRTISMGASASSNKAPKYCYKTKNGLLLTHDTSACYAQVLIGKTNNGKIAVVMSTMADKYSQCKFYTGAIGENYSGIGNDNGVIQIGNVPSESYSRIRWAGSPQITACPIPTLPSNGTSYIKGALMLVTTNIRDLGTVEIGGIKYATTGDLCLNDED